MLGYWHIYATKNGKRIALEQLDSLKKSCLFSEVQFIQVGITGDRFEELRHHKLHIYYFDNSLYEGHTLNILHDDAQQCNEDVFYIHTKGASYPYKQANENWRLEMEKYVIHNWQACVDELKSYDTCGPLLHYNPRPFFAGNFWWSKTKHIRTLTNPLDFAKERIERSSHPRYPYEEWVTSHGTHKAFSYFKQIKWK